MKKVKILFIGNSHTYFNDMPALVAGLFEKEGTDCEVVMIAHGGWFLEQHVKEPDVSFNIRYGHYDYVVLQEHAHPFGPEEKFYKAVRALNELIDAAGAKPVIYMTWAKKHAPFNQERMTLAHRKIAEETGALLAPVGEAWWPYMDAHPETEMYYKDGQHASPDGSFFAAGMIHDVIVKDMRENEQ